MGPDVREVEELEQELARLLERQQAQVLVVVQDAPLPLVHVAQVVAVVAVHVQAPVGRQVRRECPAAEAVRVAQAHGAAGLVTVGRAALLGDRAR